MKRLFIFLITSCMVTAASAQEIFNGDMAIRDFSYTRSGDYMYLNMDIDLTKFNVRNNRATILFPQIVKEGHTTDLYKVGIYGRRRYFTYLRNGWHKLDGENDLVYKERDCPDVVSYKTMIPFEPWMDGSQVVLTNRTCGCCNKILNEEREGLGSYNNWVYTPKFAFVRPTAEAVKSRSLSGSAYIDFPVSQTVIYPEYRRNRTELAKITGTIDSVRNDKDITVTAISIKGFASPESPYTNNTRLARGRTEALRVYVNNLYNFPANFISTSYEPENWEGLRKYVEESALPHRDEILALIDSGREPDNKEWKLKSTYKEEYQFLLRHCYPALRRSDYKIEYVIRGFSDPEEIRQIIKTSPQKLSLEEFYVATQGVEVGSDEFCQIFDVAVRMYPNDEVANLNAANSAMSGGNLKAAEFFLERAGKGDKALYARGVLAALREDYKGAAFYFDLVKESVPEAVDALEQLKKIENQSYKPLTIY